MTERELIITKGLLMLNYDDAFILNFVNGIGPQVSEPVDKKKERVSFSSDDKQNWKDALGRACREIEAVKSRDELAEVNRRHSRTFGKSDVYKRVLEDACRKFPSVQRYG